MRVYLWILGLILAFTSCKRSPVYLQRIEGKQIAISEKITKDSTVISLVAPYKEQLEDDMNQVLAYAPTDLTRSRDMVETNMGNFMADLCYKRGNQIFNEKTGETIDFVLLNIGGIRANISKGDVTTKNAFEVMPFENSMVVVELSYEKINELLDYLAKSGNPHPTSKHWQFVFADEQVVSVTRKGGPISKDETYYVLTSDYLQNGGDRMYFFRDPISLVDLDYKIRTAIIDELIEIDTITAKVDGRVIRTK